MNNSFSHSTDVGHFITNRGWLIGLQFLLLALTLGSYFNSIDGALVLDDLRCISEDGIHSVGIRRWVGALTLTWNHRWGGIDPLGYHLVNIAIHATAGITLFWLIYTTCTHSLRKWSGSRPELLAFVIAACWLCHPLQTQCVTYVIQRLESLASLFFLLVLLGLLYNATTTGLKAWAWGAVAVTACWLGMATKEIVAMAPLVAVLYDRTFLVDSWRDVVRHRWLMYVSMLPALGWLVLHLRTTLVPGANSATKSLGFGIEKVQWHEYLQTQPQVLLHYLRLAVWPRELVLDYDWPIARTVGEIVPAAILVVLLLFASLWAWRKHPPVGWLGLSFFLVLAPTSSFVPIADLAFEHRMYLPLAAVITVLVLGCHQLLQRFCSAPYRQRVATLGMIAVLFALCARTIVRNEDYRSGVTMWESVVASVPKNIRALNNLAMCLQSEGRDLESILHLRRAREIQQQIAVDHKLIVVNTNLTKVLLRNNPTSETYQECILLLQQNCQLEPKVPRHRCALARVLAEDNRLVESLQIIRQCLTEHPSSAEVLHCLGVIELRSGAVAPAVRNLQQAAALSAENAEIQADLASALEANRSLAEAVDAFETALRINPESADFHLRLGTLQDRMGERSRAETHYLAALRYDPQHPLAHLNLGLLLSKTRRSAGAMSHLRAALKEDSRLADAHFELARLHVKEQQWSQAATHWLAGLEIAPQRADIHNELGLTLLKLGQRDVAHRHFQRSITVDPAHTPAHVNLGVLQLQAGHLLAAEACFQTALRYQPSMAAAQKGLERCAQARLRTARLPK